MVKYLRFLILVSIIGCDTGNDTNDIKHQKGIYEKDLDIINGGRSVCYKNGSLKKWLWYNGDVNNVPLFIINFDSLGNYLNHEGMPFINAHKTEDSLTAIELVAPPRVKVFSEYRDYFEGILEEKIIYQPGRTDSAMWVTLETHKYDSTHNYFVYFVLFDGDNNFLARDSIELMP